MLFQRNPSVHHRHLQCLSHKRQEGVVIVIALFIVALIATMAYFMMSRLERDTQRTRLILRNVQAELYAQGSIAWAQDQLRDDWEKQKPNQLIDVTPIQSPVDEEKGYKIKSTIYDMQARYNLNNLINATSQDDFRRLLQALDPNLSEEKARDITRAVVDWISPNAQQNEFSHYYLTLPLAYRAAHRPMLSVSELRLVKGMTSALFAALEPYVTTLPEATVVNIQAALAPVFVTLSSHLSLETGKAIEQIRSQTSFVSTDYFVNLDIIKNHPIDQQKITVVSHYFLVETTVAIEKQQLVLYTLLERMIKDKKTIIQTLWQSKGIW